MKNISLTNSEMWPLLNILNEICYSVRISNFENKIGGNKESVLELMNKISKEEHSENASFKLNETELKMLNNSFDLIFKEIKDWEFQTRIGIPILDAKQISKKLNF